MFSWATLLGAPGAFEPHAAALPAMTPSALLLFAAAATSAVTATSADASSHVDRAALPTADPLTETAGGPHLPADPKWLASRLYRPLGAIDVDTNENTIFLYRAVLYVLENIPCYVSTQAVHTPVACDFVCDSIIN